MPIKYCGTCHKIIAPGQASTSIMNEEYHPDCLNCSKCGVRLGGRPFIQKRNGELYCEGQCEDSVTLPPINSNNGQLRRVYSFQQQKKDPSAFKEKLNFYQDLMEHNTDHEVNPLPAQQESPRKHYNLDLYKKPPPMLSTNMDIYKRFDPNEKSKNVYEPFSYNHQSNGMVMESPPTSLTNLNNLNKGKKSEPFSYNHREDTSLVTNEEATIVKKHKTKSIKSINEPFNYNRVQDFNSNMNEINYRKNPLKPNMNVPYATFDMEASHSNRVNQNSVPISQTTEISMQPMAKVDPSVYKIPQNDVYKQQQQQNNQSNVLNLIDSNRYQTNNYQSSFNKEISDYCDRCHQFIDKDKFIYNYKSYHKKCYTCFRCNTELFRMKKVLSGANDEGMYCEPCHTDMYGPKCPKCQETVTPYMLSTLYENKLYHKECFICQRCKRNLANEKFVKSGNLIICKKCY